ncbi:Rgg/GadR/MutR family transcriptional regulator [Lactococcus protaetiae]|uniref:Rgg/GadR/MutR family transcriptional regulator n=1 Tax=Lactococcus protaetiae TaxID=2592653 RepID=A0A514ZAA8_9LACT|nr:Rgg/GadR/MutR family transcriptional regulator [Lactococcus protaetiae]QDK71524.1 Rgg/GadR/MutR family transcriptional regulator [Lactococcus protaetiae]
MDKKVGPTFLMLREAKNLTLKDVTAGEFSFSQQSKFERGETSLTVDKFFVILKNSKIYLDEFFDVYENYTMSEDYVFHKELGAAHREHDLNKIKKWLNYWSEKEKNEPQKKENVLNKMATSVALAQTAGGIPFKEEIQFLEHYLEAVSQWGRYELWLFSICQHYLDDGMLKYYGDTIFEKSSFYKNIHLNQQMVLRTMLNLVDTWLCRRNLGQALIYINRVKTIGIGIEFFDEAITLRYHEGWYRYLQGDTSGKGVMLDCARDLEKYGYSKEATSLYQEIEDL